MSFITCRLTFLLRTIAFATALGFASISIAQADSEVDPPGAVYVLSNQPSGNSVLVYSRAANGILTYEATYSTGGQGAGTGTDPLGSQGSLTLQGGFLFAVNAGSNEVSLFAVDGSKLTLLDKKPSGGQMPVSVTVKGPIAYVLNAGGTPNGGTPNISGFIVDAFGKRLVPLPGSQRPLAGGNLAQPAQVKFAPEGNELLVTEKGTQFIDTYYVGFTGYASTPTRHRSNGVTPFGFSITTRGYAIVSEAGSDSVSSYEVEDSKHLTSISAAIPLGQSAPCWLVTTGDGRFAYTANAGSGSISSLRIAADGTVRLLNPTAGTLSAPLDMALSGHSKFLYVREGNGAVSGFRVMPDGTLEPLGSVTGVPSGAQGIAAR
ncbi:6-phosphogluconolactonase [Paraburkholderia sp. Clong3]|uniref:lactonase family protein n=1 Tax=unclassified Paraburkholderia TaxID=2615204 RepID=UPI001620E86E|nr:beta-propeller fold lactonase family protein [Paraburkholderia sp. CI2]MBB5465622.1 6-phosphogluconolactonase (cycloisomerase 2 family) [Paraburkholderia sp. CI2]